MDHVKFHFDPLCPWCYQTSRWARRLEELGAITLDWGVFSLEVANLPDDQDAETLDARSGPALRTAVLIGERLGSAKIGALYETLGARIWEQPPPPDDTVGAVRAALSEAGLDPALVDEAEEDRSTWDRVLAQHRALVERTGAFGVPTIVLDGDEGPAIFGPVISTMPPDDVAVEVWQHTAWLVRYGNFSELKRSRSTPPDLPTAAWYRKERERQGAKT